MTETQVQISNFVFVAWVSSQRNDEKNNLVEKYSNRKM